MMKCKACSFVMDENKIKDVCPACGLPKSVFEPYDDKLSPRRRLIMNLDLHAIVVHFPQAFAVFIPPCIIAALFVPEPYRSDLFSTVTILAFVLPLSVLASLTTGMFDGKNRFKKLNTPAQVYKMTLGSILFLLTVGIFFVVITVGYSVTGQVLIVALSALCVTCQVLLARIGVKLMFSHLKG